MVQRRISKGSALFYAERIGKNGVLFKTAAEQKRIRGIYGGHFCNIG